MSSKCLFWAIKAKVGNPQQKLVLLALADIANEKRQCWPSHSYLAEITECSRRSVVRHLAALEEKGLVQVLRRTDEAGLKTSNIYQLPDVTEWHIDVTTCHRGSDTVSHNTPIDTPIYINRAAWEEWLEYRKQAKKKMTPATIQKQHAFLSDFDQETQAFIINQSIQNGWAGLFPLTQVRGRGDAASAIETIYVD